MTNALFSSARMLFVLAASTLVACGGSSSDSQETSPESQLSASVDGHKQLSALTDAEASTLCANLDRYWKTKVPSDKLTAATCTIDAYLHGLASGGVEACSASYDKCMSGAPTPTPKIDCAAFAASARTCKHTVAELDACNVEQATGIFKLASIGKAFCENLSKKEPEPSTSAANVCQQIDLDCPDLYRHE